MHKYYVKGGANVVLDRFDPDVVLAPIERERATGVMLVPTMLVRLLRSDRLETFDIRSLRLISVGTAPISPETMAEAIDPLGPIVRQTYGLTEASQPILIMPPAALTALDPDIRARRLASSGRPAKVCVRRSYRTVSSCPRHSKPYATTLVTTSKLFDRCWKKAWT